MASNGWGCKGFEEQEGNEQGESDQNVPAVALIMLKD
jgi:hypothetical protein